MRLRAALAFLLLAVPGERAWTIEERCAMARRHFEMQRAHWPGDYANRHVVITPNGSTYVADSLLDAYDLAEQHAPEGGCLLVGGANDSSSRRA